MGRESLSGGRDGRIGFIYIYVYMYVHMCVCIYIHIQEFIWSYPTEGHIRPGLPNKKPVPSVILFFMC